MTEPTDNTVAIPAFPGCPLGGCGECRDRQCEENPRLTSRRALALDWFINLTRDLAGPNAGTLRFHISNLITKIHPTKKDN